MKKCPYCAEEIQDSAIKRRFCAEKLTPQQRSPLTESQKEEPEIATSQKMVKEWILLASGVLFVVELLVYAPALLKVALGLFTDELGSCELSIAVAIVFVGSLNAARQAIKKRGG